MTTRMLIDARHAEETRVAVLQGNRIEEFDFESAEHKQIKGNIYLAKVTRVEPSLQAAFVDFGGNRHGFLAFSEIHPDYYQIPKQDREALLAEEAEQAAEEEALRASEDEEDDADGEYADDHHDDDDDRLEAVDDMGGVTEIDTSEKDHVATIEAGLVEDDFHDGEAEAQADSDPEADNDQGAREGTHGQGRARSKQAEELRDRRMALRRRYKIQDVIQRRQVLLVQVVKEERGNKGAALTTYLSLAGRYCVLMPNSSHGGGISRKISSAADRKRLKSIVSELELPRSMGCIVRTAGLARTKTEIKRDFDYLARLWDEIRENTLGSSAPALIHSDSDLIKRAIRDIYNREIEDVVVEGEHGFHAARAFMKLLMPSHAKKVKSYADPVPLFQRFGAEDQLTAMYDPVVQLRSGGYLVINPTEALVSIDINSGRSTKEYGIEATALNTNLEAAREIARQLRLRDMAGLVVIDFIDMEHGSNVRKVEKAMKDALKNDRARIQVGRISSFGLMEMSRQRLRTGVLEASTRMCPHCDGTGLVRTASSAGLAALRLIEEEAAKGRGTVITLFASTEASIYLLNVKRTDLGEIEYRYGVSVEVIPEGENEGAKMRVGSSGPRPETPPKFDPIILTDDELDDDVDEDEIDEEEIEEARESEGRSGEQRSGEQGREPRSDDEGRRKRRKRRRSGRDRDETSAADVRADDGEGAEGDEPEDDAEITASETAADETTSGETTAGETTADEIAEQDDVDGEAPRKRRRRGRRRRGGRARLDDAAEAGEAGEADEAGEVDGSAEAEIDAAAPDESESIEEVAEAMGTEESFSGGEDAPLPEPQAVDTGLVEQPVEAPAKAPRGRRKAASSPESETAAETDAEAPAKAPRARRKKADGDAQVAPAGEPAEAGVEAEAEAVPAKPKRARRKKADIEASEPTFAALDDQPAAAEMADNVAESEGLADGPATGLDDVVAAPEGELALGEEQQSDVEESPADDGNPRRGWWQRTFGT